MTNTNALMSIPIMVITVMKRTPEYHYIKEFVDMTDLWRRLQYISQLVRALLSILATLAIILIWIGTLCDCLERLHKSCPVLRRIVFMIDRFKSVFRSEKPIIGMLHLMTDKKITASKGGERYVPYEERTGDESVVYFTRDLSAESA